MALSLDEFIQQLSDSGILSADEVSALTQNPSDDQQPADAESLAKKLVADKVLTPFQAQQIWKKKGSSLKLGEYIIIDKIGAGGMGMVFKAHHRLMKREVALKVLPPAFTKDENAIKRFLREVEAAAKLTHPNIVAAYDAGESKGAYYLIMEYVAGRDLSAIVKKHGPATVEQAVDFIIQAARGLELAHKNGVIHRDIKPANLLLDTDGVVKILDMGLARFEESAEVATQAELTGTGTIMGTVDYMSPEQALNTKTADARADIYSLGISLFYLLTGKPVYEGDTLTARLLAHQTHPIPSLRTVRSEAPESLDNVFQKMIAKQAADRYQTMTEVIADLEAVKSGSALSTSATGVLPVDAGRSEDSAMNSFLNNLDADASATDQTVIAPAQQAVAQGSDTFADSSGQLTKQRLAPTQMLSSAMKGKSRDQKRNMMIGSSVAAVLLLGAIIWGFSGGDRDESNIKKNSTVSKEKKPETKSNSSLDETAGSSISSDPDRAAAEWVLEIGGTVWTSADIKKAVKAIWELPPGAFDVTAIDLKSNNQVTDGDLKLLQRLNLGSLILDSTQISDAGLEHLKGMKSLRYLILCRSQLSDSGLVHLKELMSLRTLNLKDTKVTAAGVADLQKALPNCNIEWDGTTDTTLGLPSSPTTGKPVDLQKLLDTKRDFLDPRLKLENGKVVSPKLVMRNPNSIVMIPYKPVPEEYDVHIQLERKTDHGNGFNMGLLMGGRQVVVSMDGGREQAWGLGYLDGFSMRDEENPTRNLGRRFLVGELASVTIRVRKDGIATLFNGETIFDWKGRPEQLTLWDRLELPDSKSLFFFTQAEFILHKLTITPFDASAPPPTGAGKIVSLTELNANYTNAYPWVSSDGMRIYWCREGAGAPDKVSTVYTAERKDTNSPFENIRKLVSGHHLTLTDDELDIIVVGSRFPGALQPILYSASRKSIDQPFSQLAVIEQLQSEQRVKSPSLSSDGLTLVFQRSAATGNKAEFAVCSRVNRNSPWSEPKTLPMQPVPNPTYLGVTWPILSDDQLTLWLTNGGQWWESHVYIGTRKSVDQPFGNFKTVLKPDGKPLCGRGLSYIAATNELFFSVDPSAATGSGSKKSLIELQVFKNFQPPSAATVNSTIRVNAPPPAVAPFDEKQAKAHQQSWVDHLGEPVEYTNSIGMKLALIPPGQFKMGDDANSVEVTLTHPFRLGIYEVTQGQFKTVLGPTSWNVRDGVKEGDNYPASGVGWGRGREFCKKLTELERDNGRLSTELEYRLPTEAEWEFACRAGSSTEYYFGDDESELSAYAWYGKNANGLGEKYPHEVGLKKPNAWGLYDLYGNVSERCLDYFSENLQGGLNPQGPSDGSLRVRRGGSWASSPEHCSTANRNGSNGGGAVDGFRVVLTIDTTKLRTANTATNSIEPDNGWVDLLPIIDPQKDAYSGTWQKTATSLSNNDDRAHDRIALPLSISANYEFQLQFTRISGTDALAVRLPVNETGVDLIVSGWSNASGSKTALQMIKGIRGDSDKNPTMTRDLRLENGKPYQANIRVSGNDPLTIEVDIDQKQIIRWTGSADDLTAPEAQPGPNRIALMTAGVPIKFENLKLRMLAGRAELIRQEDVKKLRFSSTTGNLDRVAAEWVLGIGGTVTVETNEEKSVNSINDLPSARFQIVKINLQTNNQVKDSDIQLLGKLTNLRQIDLGNTNIGNLGLKHLKNLANLRLLATGGTQVTDTGLEHLKDLANLGYLSLSATQVSDEGLIYLEKLTNLRTLRLSNTKVTAAGVTDLQKTLPKCKIEWDGSKTANAPLPEVISTELKRFEGHTKALLAATFSPTGKVIASAGADRTVRIWDVGKEGATNSIVLQHPLPKGPSITSLVFNPDGSMLASAGHDGSVKLWNMTTEKPTLLDEIDKGEGIVTGFAFSPDGQSLAVGERRENGNIRIWNVSNQPATEIASIPAGIVWTLAFSPDGKTLAVGTGGKDIVSNVTLWNLTTKPISKQPFSETKFQPRSICYSPDGNVIAFGDREQVRLIDAKSGKQIRTYDGHAAEEFVVTLAFSPDGSHILSGGYDQTIQLWNVTSGKQERIFKTLGYIEQVSFSPDGKQAVSASKGEGKGNAVQLWDLQPANAK